MIDPVSAEDGHTYERRCIEDWFATGATTSPVTNEPLGSTRLHPNLVLKRLIANHLERADTAARFGAVAPTQGETW